MNNTLQTEKAFSNLVEREKNRKTAAELESAYAEILRLRRKQNSLLGCIDILLKESPDNLTLRLTEAINSYKNEY